MRQRLLCTSLIPNHSQFSTYNPPSQIRTLGLSVSISSFIFTTFWSYWGLQIWSNPAAFSQLSNAPGCTATSSTQFVVFGKSISPMNLGIRIFAILMFSIWGLVAVMELIACVRWTLVYASGRSVEPKAHATARFVRTMHTQRSWFNHALFRCKSLTVLLLLRFI